MTTRYYSSTAVQTTMTAGITGVATTMTVAATSGWPVQYPFLLILDENTASEELVLVSNVSGLTVTMSTRGYDGTAGQTHLLGATVRHGVAAIDFRDSRSHEAASTAVHGIAGAVVGDSDAQTLSSKTLASPLVTGTFPTHAHADGTSGGTIAPLTAHIAASTGVHGVTGAVVGTTDTQTLGSKTLLSPVINPATTTSKGVLVKGLFGQSDNIAEVQTSDGTPRWSVDGTGRVRLGSNAYANTDLATGVPTIAAQAGDITAPAVQAQGASGQTANVLRVVDFAGGALATVDPVGLLTANGLVIINTAAALQAGLLATSPGSSSIVEVVKGASLQTADLTQWQDASGTVLAKVTAAGAVVGTNTAFAMSAGTESFTFSGQSFLSHAIPFPLNRFSQTPLITATISSSPAGAEKLVLRTTSQSTSQFNLTISTTDGSAAGSFTVSVSWHAVQMTSSAAAG